MPARKKAVVGSTGQRNGSIKGINRRLDAKRFPRSRRRILRLGRWAGNAFMGTPRA